MELPEPSPTSGRAASIGGGRYELLRLLASGASGEVYLALDQRTGLEVALKILRAAAGEELYRLKREFRAIADIRHPCIARLYDLHVDSECCFFSMERVSGVGLLEDFEALSVSARVERILQLLPQLVAALRTVHRRGILHRDLKPENILVAEDDGGPRAVLVDFGLLAPVLPDARDTAALAELAGTIAYMAPEQLWGRPVRESADWYALGSVVQHVLSGRPPFPGSVRDIVRAKTNGDSPAAFEHESVPDWLTVLLRRLLASDAEARPDADEIEAVVRSSCGVQNDPPTDLPARRNAIWTADTSILFGREGELRILDDALGRSRDRLCVLGVSGPSGIGKSELLSRFTTVVENRGDALVFRGRCHPYEAIPRKGLDQVIDDLSRFLTIQPASCDAIDAEHASALQQLFPVLARLECIQARAESGVEREPQVVRQMGIDALCGLMGRLAATRPVVIWIDDVQWADRESAEIVATLLHSLQGRGVLVLLSYRPEGEQSGMFARLSRDLQGIADMATLQVPPLDDEAASAMVEELLLHADVGTLDRSAIIADAEGSPFFLAELVRSARASGASSPASRASRVSEVVGWRYRRLPDVARAVLDIVSVAGAPLLEPTTVAATGGPVAWTALADLERECLIRSVNSDEGRRVQPYHDRIAEGVRTQLDAARRREIHEGLVQALENEAEHDHELLTFHCSEAGQHARAAGHAIPAARRAADMLAFDRAGELFRFALEHADATVDRHELRTGLAEALANAGRGQEAGEAFEDAARRRLADAPGDPLAIELRRKGAEQLLRSGFVDEGISRMRDVLSTFGARLPETSGEAMRSFAWQRARLLVRGLTASRRPADGPRAGSQKLDAMWSTTVAVSMVDLQLSGAVQARHLMLALGSAEPDQLSLAFAQEAAWRSCLGPLFQRSAPAVLAEAKRLAAVSGHAYPLAWATMAEGMVNWHSSRFALAVPFLDEARSAYRRDCRGVFFEMALTALYQFGSLALAGQTRRLVDMVAEESEGARRRRDRFAAHVCAMGEAVHARLAADDPERAIADADEAIADWPNEKFLTPHYQHVLATAQAELYAGRPERARATLLRVWKPMRTRGYPWVECAWLTMVFLRARAALACLDRASESSQRSTLRRDARSAERRIRRSGLALAPAYAATIRAGLAYESGRPDCAAAELRDAKQAYAAVGMAMHAAACDWRLRGLESSGGDAGVLARNWSLAEGWRSLDRLAESFAPLPRP